MTPSALYRRRQAPPCPCGCGTEHGFCADHQARLAEIRADFDSRAHAKSQAGRAEKSPRRSTCCHVGCWAPREPTSPFCFEHEDDQAADA